MTKLMRAIAVQGQGKASSLVLAKAPIPVLSSSPSAQRECIIKVMAAGVNRADVLQRKGLYPAPPGESSTLGLEVAGRVVRACGPVRSPTPSINSSSSSASRQSSPTTSPLTSASAHSQTDESLVRQSAESVGVGEGVAVGDKVMALLQGGGYAEYVTVPESLCMRIPKHTTYNEAACIPEAWVTSYQQLSLIAGFHRSDLVLIHGGASGVGLALTQLSAHLGRSKTIISTCRSEEKEALCRTAGATHVIVTRNGEFADEVQKITQGRGVDVILDCVGGAYFLENERSAAADCRWVVYGLLGGRVVSEVDLSALLRKRLSLSFSTLRSRSLEYRSALVNSFASEMLNKFDNGTFKVNIDSVYKLEEAGSAHRRMEENSNAGKIVLEVSTDDSIDGLELD